MNGEEEISKQIIDIEAEACARRRGLDPQRVKSVFYLLNRVRWWYPNFPWNTGFDEACSCIDPKLALMTFETENLNRLKYKVHWMNFLYNPINEIPFYTFDEVNVLIDSVIEFLDINRSSLIETGYPKTYFTPSNWFRRLLSTLYPVKLPLLEVGAISPVLMGEKESDRKYVSTKLYRDKDTILRFKYLWCNESYDSVKDRRGLIYLPEIPLLGIQPDHRIPEKRKTTTYNYEEAEPLFILTEADIVFLEQNRERVLNIELEILKIINDAIQKPTGADLWTSCLNALIKEISADDIDTFMRIDNKYRRFFDPADPGDAERFNVKLDLIYTNLSGLLTLIGHFKCELETQNYHRSKGAISNLLPNEEPYSYFQSIGKPWREELDRVLDDFEELELSTDDFWDKYQTEVNDALEKEFYENIVTEEKVKRKNIAKYQPVVKKFSELINLQLESTDQLFYPAAIMTEGFDFDQTDKSIFTHSADYRWVKIIGIEFELNDMQAELIKILHEAHKNGRPWVRQKAWKEKMFGIHPTWLRKLGEIFSGKKGKEALRALIKPSDDNKQICLNLPPKYFS